jgi:hypothetical protein
MRAIVIILASVAALAMGALAAQPVTPPDVSHVTAAALAFEPVWMVLSGAVLLLLAGIVRRLSP